MSIAFFAVLAAAQPLPFIDRAALHALAKFEALQDIKPGAARSARDARLLSELCGLGKDAAASTADLGRVYSMSAPKVSIFKSTCALHRASTPARLGSR